MEKTAPLVCKIPRTWCHSCFTVSSCAHSRFSSADVDSIGQYPRFSRVTDLSHIWGRKPVRKGRWCNFKGTLTSGFIHPSGQQRSPLPALCFIPSSSTIPHFSHRSLFSFRPRHNGGMVMRGTEQHSVRLRACLSLWPTDSVWMLDNSDGATISHVSVPVCVRERESRDDELSCRVWARCESLCERVYSPLRVSVVAPSLRRSSSAFHTWTQTQLLSLLYVQHSHTRCSSSTFSLSVNQKVSSVTFKHKENRERILLAH